jgi:hypothetical protein
MVDYICMYNVYTIKQLIDFFDIIIYLLILRISKGIIAQSLKYLKDNYMIIVCELFFDLWLQGSVVLTNIISVVQTIVIKLLVDSYHVIVCVVPTVSTISVVFIRHTCKPHVITIVINPIQQMFVACTFSLML